MKITYREVGHPCDLRTQVLIAGKRVGDIVSVLNGYRYFPKGSNIGGDTFSTVAEVKRSLEEL